MCGQTLTFRYKRGCDSVAGVSAPHASPRARREWPRTCAALSLVSLLTALWPLDAEALGGVVASASPEATAAGADILAAGGNAIDAAVAVGFTLGVTEPAGSGIGGQTFMLIARRGEAPVVIAGSSRAPRSLPETVEPTMLVGHRLSTVPTTVRVHEFALRAFGSGTIGWKDVLAPAIAAAEGGYRLGHFRHRSLARVARKLRSSATVRSEYLGQGGVAPAAGTAMRHPLLASTLRRLAESGADDFYRGGIAADIVADMREHGGWITAADLAAVGEPEVMPAIRGRFREFDVYSLPPPAAGWVVIQGLNLLDRVAPSLLAPDNTERVVWMAAMLETVHGSRAARPVRAVEDFEAEVAARISPARADELRALLEPTTSTTGGETTHFTVADKDGTIVAVSASLNAYFGARVASPRLGFLYNDYMHEFDLENRESPWFLRGGALPYSSMSATVLANNGKPVLGLGSPGSKRIISAVLQVASHWVDGRRDIASAVAAPRMHIIPDDALFLEAKSPEYSARTLLTLELNGYSLVRPLSSLNKAGLNPYFGGVHAVAFERGEWRGAADPRRDGTVLIVP